MSAFRDILCLLRACSKSSSLCQNALIFEHRSAVYIKVNEQRSAKNRWVMAKIGDFEQALTGSQPIVSHRGGLLYHSVGLAFGYWRLITKNQVHFVRKLIMIGNLSGLTLNEHFVKDQEIGRAHV